VSEQNLSRQLSTSIVDALKLRGHIVVTRGGAAALARELEDKMADDIETIAPRLDPWAMVDGEVTSTFAEGGVDDEVEVFVASLTQTVLESEHIEDIMTEDAAIRRDMLRALRGALLGTRRDLGGDDDGPARVRLDGLGYVAAMAARRAPPALLHEALDRAGQNIGCRLSAYDPETREATFSVSEATFSMTAADLDTRLDLEQSVADELAELVTAKRVSLPSAERRIELGPGRARLARGSLQRLDEIAAKALHRPGCTGAWEVDGKGALRVTITPLSEQEALDIDRRVTQLAQEINAMLDEASAKKPAAKKTTAKKTTAKKTTAKKTTAKKTPAKKTTAKKTPAKKSTKKGQATKKPAKKPAAKKSAKTPAAAKRTAAKKSPSRGVKSASKSRKAPARKRSAG
jgi:hypothetical protein